MNWTSASTPSAAQRRASGAVVESAGETVVAVMAVTHLAGSDTSRVDVLLLDRPTPGTAAPWDRKPEAPVAEEARGTGGTTVCA